MRRRVRLTPLGYLVAAVLVLIILVGLYFILRGLGGGEQPAASPSPPLAGTAAPGASEAPGASGTAAPVGPVSGTPAPGTVPGVTTQAPGTPVPTIAPTQAAAEAPPEAPDTVRTPTPDEERSALDGKLNAAGVAMRAAPSTEGRLIDKYVKGTNLKVYGESGDYYYVQVVKLKLYGYIAKRFVDVDTSTPEPITTSVPSGAVGGEVRASLVALRSAPDLSDDGNKVGQVEQGEPVYIYFQYTNSAGDSFYYIEVARTGKKAYAFAEYITAEASVPTGTPAP